MPLTSAERQKRYRERLKVEQPEKYEALRKKHLEKVKQNVKKIHEMTEAEKSIQRQKWKKANDKRSFIKKETADLICRPTSENNKIQIQKKEMNNKTEEATKMKNTIIKAENEELKRINRNLKRKLYRYKAEVTNLRKKLMEKMSLDNTTMREESPSSIQPQILENSVIEQAQLDVTPLTKTKEFLKELPSISNEEKEKVKKKILLLNTLTGSIKESYNKADTSEKKSILKNIVLNDTASKYNIKTTLTSTLGLKGRIRAVNNKFLRRKKYLREIHNFYNRDDISRATAGKQECITKNKQKKQKRYLQDTMQKLHAKYISEGGKSSYTTFARYRPFYVIAPRLQDRNTCGCIKHSNIGFKATTLKQLEVTQISDIDTLIKNITCKEFVDCMYSKCSDCINKIKDIVDINSNINKEALVQWSEWQLKNHEYTKITKGKEETKIIKKYIKVIVKGTVAKLTEEFLKELSTFKIHYYNMKYQYKAYRKYIDDLEDEEVVLVCDFSENYTCKLSEEIQACHFQAEQITLHTCVLYQKNEKPKSICTISPVNEHGPGAIWAHLDPILAKVAAIEPNVKKIHVFSDGPTTQYRQKNNFYLFTKRLFDYGFQAGTWNFFEAAHGKGAADGVGAAVKRKLDQCVAHGKDITSAEEAFTYLSNNINVEVHFVSAKDIEEISAIIPNNVVPLEGTMKLHQIIYNNHNKQTITYRTLSCICKETGNCTCEGETGYHQLLRLKDSNQQENITNESAKTIHENQENIPVHNSKQETNKLSRSHEKITILSSVRLKHENRCFIGAKMLPLQLKRIDRNIDILTSHKKNITLNKITQKRTHTNYSTGRKNKISKRAKRSRNLSCDSTSTESDFSVYDDDEILELPSDDHSSDEHLESNQIITKPEIHNMPQNTNYIRKNRENYEEIQETVNIERRKNKLNTEKSEIIEKTKQHKCDEETENEKVSNVQLHNALLHKNVDNLDLNEKIGKKYHESGEKSEKKKECEYKLYTLRDEIDEELSISEKFHKQHYEPGKEPESKKPCDYKLCTLPNEIGEGLASSERFDKEYHEFGKDLEKNKTFNYKLYTLPDEIGEESTFSEKFNKERYESRKEPENNNTYDYKVRSVRTLSDEIREKLTFSERFDREHQESKGETEIEKKSDYKLNNAALLEKVEENVIENFSVGDTVLIRYFTKQSWKYYVGTITEIDLKSKMYTIIFFKTKGKNDDLKFILPKRNDLDVVPYISLVKTIELLQISEKPKEYVLMNDEDLIYFN